MKSIWPKKKSGWENRPSGFLHRPLRGVMFKKKKPHWKAFFGWLVIVGVAGLFAASIGGAALFAWLIRDLPNPNRLQERALPQTTKLYDRTGQTVLYEVHGDEKRTIVNLNGISTNAKNATIAIEDQHFYEHGGFRPTSIIRAVLADVIKGKWSQGGSTITQQLVKNSILTKDKTITRKLKELALSIEIERRYTKDDILKMYLNEIPYGSMAYGIESAAQTYFGKSAKDLTLDEAALLAAVPQAPTYYSPFGNHRDDLVSRQHLVLDKMVESGYISSADAEAAKKTDTLAKLIQRRNSIIAPHFVFYVKEQLAEQFGEQAVEEGGLKVITTLDVNKQKLAEQAVADNLKVIHNWNANSAALLSLDPKNGDILAMVGSADYFDDSINGKFNALTGRLQPGSSIKPMVYATAFERGYTPNTVVYDVSTEFSTNPSQSYHPSDYDGKERGPVTLKQALAGSLNIPAVKVLYLVGIRNFLDFATGTLGYTIPDRDSLGLSLTLGGVQVNPIEHINAFAALARDGKLARNRAILRVEDANGNVLLRTDDSPPMKTVFSEQTAREIDDILSDNSARSFIFGEKNNLTLADRPVAAKTGTTNDWKDAWTIGFTPSLVAGVWVGDQVQGKHMKAGADGSVVAAPIWNEYMRLALAGSPVENFTPPDPVETGKPVLDGDKSSQFKVKIDKFTGKLATDLTPPEMVEERAYGGLHEILFFVTKDDPRGPMPTNPQDDPQFGNWEKAVADWAENQGIKPSGGSPPTEQDDVHVPENFPSVSFVNPTEGATFSTREPTVSVTASARRGVASVEYRLDGERVGYSDVPPFTATLSIPNHFLKGFHVLSAAAYDDARNQAQASININLNAPADNLGLIWRNLYDSSRLFAGQLPFQIKMSVPDIASIAKLTLNVTDSYGYTTTIGSIDHPPLPDMVFEWKTASPGFYSLQAEGQLVTGETLTSTIRVSVE